MNDDRTGSSFHLAGDMEPWLGILLALATAGLAWWLYRLETRKGTVAPLDKLLPLLRAVAAGLIVMILTGPTISNVSEKGQRGRVLVFLDASKSMSIKDDHMSPGRKLLLAERHGWLPKDQNLLDPALLDAADLLAEARTSLSDGLSDPAADLKKLKENFAKKAEQASELLSGKEYEVSTAPERKGVLYHEVWKDIPGGAVTSLTNHPKFKEGNPDSTDYLTSAESPLNVGDNFGRRIRGIIIPPESGNYRFSLSADDECVIRLNNAGENPENAREILKTQGTSGPIALDQSKRYYFEILHKEAGGDDFCKVGWTLPGGKLESPIPGKHFRMPSYDSPPTFPELRESMRAEVVKEARSLKKGTDDAAESTMRAALSKLSETALAYENRFRATFEVYADNRAAGNDENIIAAISSFDSIGRWERATRLLTQRQNTILKELADTHIIEVRSLAGLETERLWDNTGDAEPPTDFGQSSESRRTDLASGVQTAIKADDDNEEEKDAKQSRTAVVILSDGLHNIGASPFEVAKLMAGRDIPIHTIGFGSVTPPIDLAVIDVETPAKVLKDDRVRGSVTLKDNLTPGTPFKIVIEDDLNQTVWEESFSGMSATRRRVDFDFSVKKLVEERISALGLDNSVDVNAVPFRMKVRVEPVEGEARDDNNVLSFAFDAITKKNSVLIVDGRPRWETRYLRNVFDRDERWSVTAVFAGLGSAEPELPRGEEGEVFPQDRKTLFGYDLLVIGELHEDLLKEEELLWIRDFVANRGGGILLLDGPRQKFREYAKDENHPISQLLPVKWLENSNGRFSPKAFRLTERGESTTALFLNPSPERNTELWGYLPVPGWVAPTEALPGTEVFLEAIVDEEKYGTKAVPLLVTRTIGAGKALYAGFDGTWRWRFEVGDKYHQRYWNQIASWIMEKPFAVQDDFVAIDPGASTYRPGDSAALRIRVRDKEGKPLDDPGANVEALIWKEGKIVATVPMETSPESGGLFRGTTPPLLPGKHEITVRANGVYEENELRSRVEFLVQEPESPELSTLTCNENLLKEVAKLSGGTYLREEQIGRLGELLKPISSGRLVTKEIALWQSYWWFVPIILILGLELFLRKRAGML
jgi:hypothetical protein